MVDVIGIGSPALDIFFNTDNNFLKELNLKPEDDFLITEKKLKPTNITSRLKPVSQSPGGIAVNTLAVLSNLGIKTAYLGVVGKDKIGANWLKTIQNVETSRVLRLGKTSICFCLLTDNGKKRTFLSIINNHENDFLKNINYKFLNTAKFVHIGPLIKNRTEGIKETINLVSKIKSPKISFSPGIFYTSQGLQKLKPILKKTYILFINLKEIKSLISKDPKIASGLLLEFGPKIIVLTMADKGSFIATKNEQFRVKRENAEKIVDATGAGDSYAAGFLYGLLMNKSLEWSAKFASKLAAKSLSDYGINWIKK